MVRILKALVAAEAIFSILSMTIGLALEKDLPSSLQAFISEQNSQPMNFARGIVSLVALVAVVVAWIGLWRLKVWARTLYSIASVAGFLVMPFYGPVVSDGTANMVGQLAVTAGGATLALIWLSPISNYFNPSNESPSADAANR